MNDISDVPSALWPVLNSAQNLTPRGKQSSLSQSAPQDATTASAEFDYKLFLWNGNDCGAIARAFALSRGNELDHLLAKAKDNVLRALFGGGVIRGTKLQRGSVYTFEDVDLNANVGVQMSHMT